MKKLFPSLACALALLPSAAQPASATYRVEVKCEQKRVDVKTSGQRDKETAEEKWAYRVTIVNRSFKDVPDLRVEYLVFSKREKFGSLKGETVSKRDSGNKSLGTLPNNGSIPFETDPVMLKQSRLKGGWTFNSGAKRRAKDELTGLWLRIYSGNELIEEFAQPPSLKTAEKWDG